jgi:hypothetical protein
VIERRRANTMTFAEYWEMIKKDYEEGGDPVWNMGLERYNDIKAEAFEMYKKFIAE